MSNLGKAARARRFYHHVLNGGKLTPGNVSIMVQTIEELEAENFALAAQQCLFSDGSGLSGDEWGHQYCAMKRRAAATG